MAQRKSITKTEAVRQALKQLGKDAARPQLQSFIKDETGLNNDIVRPEYFRNAQNEHKPPGRGRKSSLSQARPTACMMAAARLGR